MASEAASVDPRVERSRRVVLQAALAELADAGYGGFAIESVAARAGVGKSTIYRHWGTKLALLRDVLESLNVQPTPRSSDEAPRTRVTQLVRHFAEVLSDPVWSACMIALIEAAERETDLRALYRDYAIRRRRALVEAISDGIAAGDFARHHDPELAALALTGALLHERVIVGESRDPAAVPDLVTTVLGPPR